MSENNDTSTKNNDKSGSTILDLESLREKYKNLLIEYQQAMANYINFLQKESIEQNNPFIELKGKVFLSVSNRDKSDISYIAKKLHKLGYQLIATRGTAAVIKKANLPVEEISKLQEGRPNLIDLMKNGQIALILNTPVGRGSRTDEGKIRSAAVTHGVTCITTMAAAQAAVEACAALREKDFTVTAIQDRY